MDKIGIYKIESPNGKCYIGQSFFLESRLKQHFGNDKYKKTLLRADMDKLGSDNFKVKILWSTNDDTNAEISLNQFELDFINLYNSYHPNGYNISKGGKVNREKNPNRVILNKPIERLVIDSNDILENMIKIFINDSIDNNITVKKHEICKIFKLKLGVLNSFLNENDNHILLIHNKCLKSSKNG